MKINLPVISEETNDRRFGAITEEYIDEIEFPPSDLESDEPPLESDLHREQIDLLIRLLKYWWRDRHDFYISGNLTVFYNQQQLKSRDFRGPDVFVVMDAEPKPRKSWAVWEEGGKYPNLVIELLSSSTARVDRGTKKQLYQDIWRLPNYFWFDPHNLEFAGFHLVDNKYQAIPPTDAGLLWSDQLELYLGVHEQQLRWFTADSQLIPLPEEQESLAKEQSLQRAAKLEAILRSQGIDPDQI